MAELVRQAVALIARVQTRRDAYVREIDGASRLALGDEAREGMAGIVRVVDRYLTITAPRSLAELKAGDASAFDGVVRGGLAALAAMNDTTPESEGNLAIAAGVIREIPDQVVVFAEDVARALGGGAAVPAASFGLGFLLALLGGAYVITR